MGKLSGQLLRVSQVIQVARERRDSKRAPCRLVCPFELTKFVDKSTVKLRKGFGHAIKERQGHAALASCATEQTAGG